MGQMKKSHSLPIEVLINIGTNLPFITWESKGKMSLIMEFHETVPQTHTFQNMVVHYIMTGKAYC